MKPATFQFEAKCLNHYTTMVHCDFSLLHQLNVKLKGRHFDTIDAIEAESQAMLNTLTEHDFQDAFKKWQKRWEWCICVEGYFFEGDSDH
jgi:hypothetical protein